ncbi:MULTISPECIES: DUF3231 family protein [Metabacillus]|uniref:DUF3231 family protein n=1 Tax=Metabacillus hrfriensis TaxID=3048891 RepID=A0ACD4RGK3_9BACI|nr:MULTISPECIES: DUF3231 family protein [Metabacillus]UAL53751.1 DUF3231 family protein [Metabacillus dongyingensis]USK30062.1 DUF3231 family protein [Bacillus sp. CMF21]WHZ59305.1 DUF3231 family protein [Metabacillus sp. CT-WN-B3]
MGDINHNTRLTSAEISNLWSQFVNDSMALCVISYYLKNVKDNDIRSVLEFALDLSHSHIESIKEFFMQDNYPIPKGFTIEDDVNLKAPPLFSDPFLLVYLHIMTIHGLLGYAGAVGTSIREDQRKYFIKCNMEAMELYNMIMDAMLNKGIVSRPPAINAPDKIQFVEKQSYLTGWLGRKRPLNAIEVSGIYFNMLKNVVKIVLEIGFSQVAESKEVREYIQRGKGLCDKQFTILSSFLSEDNLHSPKKWDDEVTSSTVSPFSDKLLIFHIVSLISTASAYYGAAYSLSQRRDLAAEYLLLIADVTKYAEDGVNIMIDNGWMEQPPIFDDRNDLANKK